VRVHRGGLIGKGWRVFDGRVSWLQAAQRYDDPLLQQADQMYMAKQGALLID
jgi:hypothetical protein